MYYKETPLIDRTYLSLGWRPALRRLTPKAELNVLRLGGRTPEAELSVSRSAGTTPERRVRRIIQNCEVDLKDFNLS